MLVGLVLATLACSNEADAPSPGGAESTSTREAESGSTGEAAGTGTPGVDRAIRRAIAYIDGGLDGPDASPEQFVFYLSHFLERRFELGVWESLPEEHAAFLDSLEHPDPQKEYFRRLIDPDHHVTATELDRVEDVVDKVTTRALHCREVPLPHDYATRLRKLAVGGRYHLTHAALAMQWMRENGCGPVPQGVESYVVDLMAAGVRAGDATDDLEIERATFLTYLGHPERVPDGFVLDLVRSQNPDGGWSIEAGGPSNWHPTLLALWFLLESEGGSNGRPMIVEDRD
jgi:hypothetical protein